MGSVDHTEAADRFRPCNHSAATGPSRASPSTSGSTASRGAWRSKKSVVVSPARKASWRSTAVRRSRLVTTPPTCSRSRARASFDAASSRVGAWATTLASIGSNWVPTTEPASTPESQRTAGSGAGSKAASVPVAGRKPLAGSSA